MLIKHQALPAHLKKPLPPLIALTGTCMYLFDSAHKMLKDFFKDLSFEDTHLHIESAQDWQTLLDEANSYSLFATNQLIQVHVKKSIDAGGKQALSQYLADPNDHCKILLRLPQVQDKQLAWLSAHKNAIVISNQPLSTTALGEWIRAQLNARNLKFNNDLIKLIQAHSEGNMLATSQIIEHLALTTPPNTIIKADTALLGLMDQSEYQLFDLIDTLLTGNGVASIHILRQLANTRTEPSLVLWLFTNEIRLLLKLNFALKHKPFTEAARELKIWTSRTDLYRKLLLRLQPTVLTDALALAKQIDEMIKSNTNTAWHGLEQLALVFCHTEDKKCKA